MKSIFIIIDFNLLLFCFCFSSVMYGMNGFNDDSNEYVMVQVTPLPSGEVTPLQSYNNTPLTSANATPLPIKKWPCSNDSDTGTDILPICRICHLPGDKEDSLFKPCRCSGTLRFIHNGCLMVSLFAVFHFLFVWRPCIKYAMNKINRILI